MPYASSFAAPPARSNRWSTPASTPCGSRPDRARSRSSARECRVSISRIAGQPEYVGVIVTTTPVVGRDCVAHDAELHDAHHRNLRIHHRVEDLEQLLARRKRALHHEAPGCERATICISAQHMAEMLGVSSRRGRRAACSPPPERVSVARSRTSSHLLAPRAPRACSDRRQVPPPRHPGRRRRP